MKIDPSIAALRLRIAELEADIEGARSELALCEANRECSSRVNHVRIAQLEAALKEILREIDDIPSWKKLPCVEDARALLNPTFAAKPPRAHSKSEYKRLTALGVECVPPETKP